MFHVCVCVRVRVRVRVWHCVLNACADVLEWDLLLITHLLSYLLETHNKDECFLENVIPTNN